MTKYYEVSFKGKSVEACDHIAMCDAGVLGVFSFGYAVPKGGDVNAEYYSVVTDSRGMGNHGKVILRGKTARARDLLKEGKVRRLMGEHKIRRAVAEKCAVMHRGMEGDVARFADSLVDVALYISTERAAEVSSHRQFSNLVEEVIDIPDGLSLPRKCSALAIAFAAVEGSGVIRVSPAPEAGEAEKPRLKASLADFISASRR